jgi:hypothetical protein
MVVGWSLKSSGQRRFASSWESRSEARNLGLCAVRMFFRLLRERAAQARARHRAPARRPYWNRGTGHQPGVGFCLKRKPFSTRDRDFRRPKYAPDLIAAKPTELKQSRRRLGAESGSAEIRLNQALMRRQFRKPS